MRLRNIFFLSFTILVTSVSLFWGCSGQDDQTKILLFTKTEGFRHASIPFGVEAVKELGKKHHFQVDHTEDAAAFKESSLKIYDAVIFLNTTGNVLDPYQQADLERFIQAGGGFVGIHAAADTEYDWPWYGKMVGAYFDSHPSNPNVRQASIEVLNNHHPATDSLPARWQRTDEWYNYKSISNEINVLLNLDESSYEGGTNGENHPISWYHEYDGGKAFYTGGGHTAESYSEPLFLEHLWGGIRYVLGEDLNNDLQYSKVRTEAIPEETRFNKVVLDENLFEPMELAVLDENRILFIERRGNVKLYDVREEKTKIIATLDVFSELEDGLIGLAIDPDFRENHWVYLYYAPAGPKAEQHLSRFRMTGDSLDVSSEQLIFTVATQRKQCCHSGGSLEFGPDGNLYLSTGDNTNPFASDGYAPLDERPGRQYWDDQRTAANTNDLRGKILRIRPTKDGSYTIPDGNLFGKNQERTRPEIYIMGDRNPYRISIDPKTGYLYWGEVGPDANKNNKLRGPRGYDEINQAREAGNFGWPYFIGDNKPYRDYNFATKESGPSFNPDNPVNNSVNNTGIKELPPARKAFIWYPYAASEEFPLVGSGGRTAMAGPVYYPDRYGDHPAKFPEYYEGKLFIYEWVRNWIMAVTLDENHNFVRMEPFMPSADFDRPVDMQFDPNGRLYLLEYGTAWFKQNSDARLVRIDYNPGNRPPVAQITARKTTGAAPLTVQFSSGGSKDYDHGDEIEYKWDFGTASGSSAKANPAFTYKQPGVYTAKLTVTDSHGASSIAGMEIRVGNEPPDVSISLEGNNTFYYDREQRSYNVQVSDKEDGSLEAGSIRPEEVIVSFTYLEEGLNNALGHQAEAVNALSGKRLIEVGECQACHAVDENLVGPGFRAVAERYRKNEKAVEILTAKIIQGGSGNWGDRMMPAHPELSEEKAEAMVNYILSVGETKKENESLPVQGAITTKKPDKEAGKDEGYLLSAVYTDRGANGISPLTGQAAIALRKPRVSVFDANGLQIATRYTQQENGVTYAMVNDGSYFHFSNIDLTGIDKLVFSVMDMEKGGSIELREGSVTGDLLATAEVPGGEGALQAEAVLPGIKGKRDLYIVIKSKTHPGQTLFLMDSIFFQSTE